MENGIVSILILVALFVGLVIAAYPFGIAIRIVCGFQPSLLASIYYFLLIAIIQSIISFFVGFGLEQGGVANQFVRYGSSLFLSLVVNPFVIGRVVKNSDGTGIGFRKGFLVYLANLFISGILALVCCGLPKMLMGSFLWFEQFYFI